MACPNEQEFVDLVDGRLDDASSAALHAHAGSCDACRELLAAMARNVTPDGPGDGETIAHYRLGEVLGRGGMGVVHRAFDTKLRRTVAVKLLAPGLADDPQARARLEREARATAALDHPNVGGMYEIGQHEGRVFLVMPFFDGGTVKDKVARAPLEYAAALGIARQLVAGLAAAHRAGIVHRDVKPSNVLLSESGAKLVDFGLAKLSDASATLSATGQMIGTPAYMAPEQFEGRSDERSDVWGAGVVIYELLAGRSPWSATTALAMHAAINTKPPAPMGRADVPRDLETIVQKCLEKDPRHRYASAVELEQDLERVASARPVVARRRGRGRRAALAAALIAVVAAATSGVLLLRRSSAERTRRVAEMNQQANDVRAIMREASLMPLHDTRPERAQVRARMKAVERALADLGPSVAATAHYALGAGHLALGELTPAKRELEAAWQAGEHGADASFLLGLAGSRLYRQGLHEAREQIASEKERAAREKELQTTLRDPALARLAEAAQPEERDFVQALIAFDEGRLEDARVASERAFAAAPRRYAAGAIEAEAESALATDSWRKGNRDAAQKWFERARATYVKVTDIARSDPEMYQEAAGQLYESFRVRRELDQVTDAEMKALVEIWQKAQQADPDNVDLMRGEGDAEWMWGAMLADHGGDWKPHVTRMLSIAEQVLVRDPNNWRALVSVGVALLTRNDIDGDVSGLPKAAVALEKAVAVHASSVTRSQLGNVYVAQAREEADRGLASYENAERGRRELEAALQLDTSDQRVVYNLGDLLTFEARERARDGQDNQALLDAAEARLKSAVELDKLDPMPRERLADLYVLVIENKVRAGKDPSEALAKARAEIETALRGDPRRVEVWRSRSVVDGLDARWRLSRGLDATSEANRASADLDRVVEYMNGVVDEPTRFDRIRVNLLIARAALQRHAPAERALARALDNANQVTANVPEAPIAWLVLAETRLWRARAHHDPTEAARGLEALAQVGAPALNRPQARALHLALAEAHGDKTQAERDKLAHDFPTWLTEY
jgi:tetratricopeptide (TPR) repeat protein